MKKMRIIRELEVSLNAIKCNRSSHFISLRDWLDFCCFVRLFSSLIVIIDDRVDAAAAFWGVDSWSNWCEIAAIHLSPPQQLHQLFATRVTSLIANSCNLRLTRRLRCCCNVSLLFLGSLSLVWLLLLLLLIQSSSSLPMFSPNRRKIYISTDFQLFSSFLYFFFSFFSTSTRRRSVVVVAWPEHAWRFNKTRFVVMREMWRKEKKYKRRRVGEEKEKKYVKEKRIHKVKTREWWRKKGEDEPKPLYCTTNKTKHKKIYIRRE